MALQKRAAEWQASMDMFPFLTVLICIIGTLMMIVLTLNMMGLATGAIEYPRKLVDNPEGGTREPFLVECRGGKLIVRWENFDPTLKPEEDDLGPLGQMVVLAMLTLPNNSYFLVNDWIHGDAARKAAAKRKIEALHEGCPNTQKEFEAECARILEMDFVKKDLDMTRTMTAIKRGGLAESRRQLSAALAAPPKIDDLARLVFLCFVSFNLNPQSLVIRWLGGDEKSRALLKELLQAAEKDEAGFKATCDSLLALPQIKSIPGAAALLQKLKVGGFKEAKQQIESALALATPPASPYARLLTRIQDRSDREYVYFMIRPSGVPGFQAAEFLIRQSRGGLTFGKEVELTEDRPITLGRRETPK